MNSFLMGELNFNEWYIDKSYTSYGGWNQIYYHNMSTCLLSFAGVWRYDIEIVWQNYIFQYSY